MFKSSMEKLFDTKSFVSKRKLTRQMECIFTWRCKRMGVEMKAGVSRAAYTAESIKMSQPQVRATESKVADTKATEYVSGKEATVQLSTQFGSTAEQQQDATGKGKEQNESRRLKSAVDHANTTMKQAKTKCEFSYHEETKRVSIKVIDEDTKEVIKEIPPEETLEMIAKMWELAGILVDEKR